MSMVGSGFGSSLRKTALQKMEVNPLDKCTIVSVYHQDVVSIKPTIAPGRFVIPGVKNDTDFSLTVVGPSSWWKEIDEHQPFLEIVCSSYQVANAIVNDYVNSLHGGMGHTRKPGIFVVLGEYNQKNIHSYTDKSGNTFAQLLAAAREAQRLYYTELVKIADVLWARTNGNPLAISNEARMAAEKLGLKEAKTWMGDFRAMELTNCKACGHRVNPIYPVCPNCKNVINETKAKEIGLKFAS